MKRILTDAASTLACVPVAICGRCVSQFRRTGYSASDLNEGIKFLNSKKSDLQSVLTDAAPTLAFVAVSIGYRME